MLHVVGVAKQRFPLSPIQCALLLFGAAASISAPGTARGLAISSVAPYEVLASGFQEISGLAVEPDGSVLVTDRSAGTLTRISAAGRQVVLANLQIPHGVAITSADGLFVLEDRTRVLRLDWNGVLSLASSSPHETRAIAAGPDGRIWIATRQPSGPHFQIALLETSGAIRAVAGGFVEVRGLAVNETGIYLALDALTGEYQNRTRLARLRWREDGSVGPIESLIRNTISGPSGLAIDAAGEAFITGAGLQPSQPGAGVVLKRRSAGTIVTVASGLSLPGAAAFGPARDLFVVERGSSSRVLRFRPPAPPEVQVPSFTNRTPLRVTGRAQPASLLQVFGASGSVLASGAAHSTTGAFAVNVPLALNQHNGLSVVETAKGGAGLVGLPATASTLHDDHSPVVQVLEPPSIVHVRDVIAGRARAEDQGSGMATLEFKIDQIPQAGVQTAQDGEPLTAAPLIQAATFSEGLHTLTAVAVDRAGNLAAAAQLVVVDRTPPETTIQPPAETADRGVVFELGGFDAQSVELDFSWRLDGGPWSAFSRSHSVSLTQLAGGSHRFEAAARDQAGNTDATPAAQAFTVTTAQVRIGEPASGATVGTATTWIRGVVTGADDVSLSIPLPLPLQKELGLAALPVPHEAGSFAAEMPVVPGMTSVTVIARDSAGVESADTVGVVVVEPLIPTLRLEGHPAAGFAPHAVRFPANGFPAGSVYSLDLESDGIAEYTGNALANQEFVFARPGIHLTTLTVLVPDGRTLVARGAIEVYDRTTLETRLRTLWSSFKAALRAGDIAAAAAFVHADRRSAWVEYFGRLTPAQFAATDATLREIVLVEVTPGRAECQMVREEAGVSYSFPVSFEIDADRGWRLWQF